MILARSQKLRVSLVIPAYNEEAHLAECLQAIAKQTVKPFEVIVVDNNSTDQTTVIARSYPFTRVISEKQQGIVFARNTGFDAATGDVIARLDADVIASPDWIARVQSNFDHGITALTGLARAPLIGLYDGQHWGESCYWMRLYLWWSDAYFGVRILCGANLALRRDAWLRIRQDTCNDPGLVHEDQDLSLLIAAMGGVVRLDKQLLVTLDEFSHNEWDKFRAYMRQRSRTKQYHRAKGTLTTARGVGTSLAWWHRAGIMTMIIVPGIPFYLNSLCILAANMAKALSAKILTERY
jgi:glycosyltransferase involved in cell wall biosynthesis